MPFFRNLLTEPYWWVVGLFLVATLFVYFFDAKYRKELDGALAKLHPGRPSLKAFDLSRGNASEVLRHKHLIAPERLWTYDDDYVEKFTRALWPIVRADKSSMLDLYVERILRRWDLAFAVAMGLFTALFNYGVATEIATACPIAGRLVVLAAGMGILYGVADIAENLKLSSILKFPEDIDAGQVAATNFLTRLKMVSLTLSASGGILFVVLVLLTLLFGKHDAVAKPQAQT